VGRDELLDGFEEAIEDGPGAAGRATLYTGPRGAGKTVLLNEVEDRAASRGWLVVSETATAGFVKRIVGQHLPRLLLSLDPNAVKRRMSGASMSVGPLGGAGVNWDTAERHALRNQIELLTSLVEERDGGLLITLDEIHHNQIAELRELAVVVQHAFREGRELAFVGAGLTSTVSDVVNDDVLTFLRRADRFVLGAVARSEVRRAIRQPIEIAGRSIGDEALEVMTEGTDGFPFLIQLIGAQTWRRHPEVDEVTLRDAEEGVAAARRRLGVLVYEPALAGASSIARTFLLAMARDDGPSKMADIQERLGVDANYASQYRLRLIALDLIESTGYGYVDFALPYLREYLRDEAASGV
jgi:hypothetical protein